MPSVSDVLKFTPFIGPMMDIEEGFGDVSHGNYLKGSLKMATGAGFLVFDFMTLGTLSSALHGATVGATKMVGKTAARQFMSTAAEREVVKHLASRTVAAGVAKGGARVVEKGANAMRSRSGNTSNKSGTSSSASAGAPQPPKPPHQRKEPIPVPKLGPNDTESTTEGEALRKAKEKNGIAGDAKECGARIYVIDNRTKESLPVYKFKSKNGKYFYIRRDNAARYNDNNPDQPPHFNVSESQRTDHADIQYDVQKTREDYRNSRDLGQHHYFPE